MSGNRGAIAHRAQGEGVMEFDIWALFKNKELWIPGSHCPGCSVPVMYTTQEALEEDWKNEIEELGLKAGPAKIVYEEPE